MTTDKKTIPSNITDLDAAHVKATEAGKKFAARLKGLNAMVDAKKVEMDSLLAQIDPSVRKASEVHYNNEFSNFQKEMRRASDKERWDTLRELQGLYESTAYARENLGNPRNLATQHGLSGESRSRLERSLEKMGPAALASLAKKAEVTGDKDLAAALIAINDTMPARERPFSSQGLSEKLFGDEAQVVRDLVTGMNRELQSAMTVNRAFEGTKIAGHQKIKNGLDFDGHLVPQEKGAPAPVRKTSLDRISEGLADL